MFIIILLLSSCSKSSFLKSLSLVKTNDHETQVINKKRDVNYVIGEEKKKNHNIKENENKSDLSEEYLETKNLLEILKKDKENLNKVENKSSNFIDYSETKTLSEMLEEEKKNISKDNRESNFNQSEFLPYTSHGYESTIGCEDNLYC